ncbi:MAG: bacitracin transport ATP-binding protein BcrA [Anaerocolumna sp.]|jgi:ABC-2 type transport system ATP-binding protein|nr:bacitracin transport ATP-binding protein BcrA [Anaerocolumna sp.]
MDYIIEMNSVKKIFKEKTALKNLNVQVKEGEIFGFLGPSGAGKTTTIKLLTSQLLPTKGSVKVLGKEVYANKQYLYENIGVLSDNSGIYDRLSVWDNLSLYAELYGINKEAITDLLNKVGLSDNFKTEAKKLSKGMKQRLMIARAVLHNPKLLFLDEPTATLDPGNALEIHKLLNLLNKEGTTIFLTTHNMEEADKLCHRVAFLNDGEIVELGTPSELKLKYINDDITVILKENQEKIKIKNSPSNSQKIMDWMNQGQLLSIHTMEPTLEKIFLTLTGREL